MIDSGIIYSVAIVIGLMLVGALSWVGVIAMGDWGSWWAALDSMPLQIAGTALVTILTVAYYVYGTYKYGTTLGKRPLGIFVLSYPDLKPITLRQSVLRCIGYLPSSILGVGYLMAAFHPEKRALHDLIAGTVSVIRRSDRASAPTAPQADGDFGSAR